MHTLEAMARPSTTAPVRPVRGERHKRQARRRFPRVCPTCRTPIVRGCPTCSSGLPPVDALITLWGIGRDISRHFRLMPAARGILWASGQVALLWNDGTDGAPAGRVETFASMRALFERYGAEWEIIRREWG